MAYHPLNIKMCGKEALKKCEILCQKNVDEFHQGVIKGVQITESPSAPLSAVGMP